MKFDAGLFVKGLKRHKVLLKIYYILIFIYKYNLAAGVIHTDFEKGFICADVMTYDDFIKYGSELKVK